MLSSRRCEGWSNCGARSARGVRERANVRSFSVCRTGNSGTSASRVWTLARNTASRFGADDLKPAGDAAGACGAAGDLPVWTFAIPKRRSTAARKKLAEYRETGEGERVGAEIDRPRSIEGSSGCAKLTIRKWRCLSALCLSRMAAPVSKCEVSHRPLDVRYAARTGLTLAYVIRCRSANKGHSRWTTIVRLIVLRVGVT